MPKDNLLKRKTADDSEEPNNVTGLFFLHTAKVKIIFPSDEISFIQTVVDRAEVNQMDEFTEGKKR